MKGVPRASLEKALGAYARENRMVFSPTSASPGNGEVLTIGSEGTAHAVLYPGSFMDWDAASAFLSTVLSTPVVSIHIHEGDLTSAGHSSRRNRYVGPFRGAARQ
jgi:hypothetical protein